MRKTLQIVENEYAQIVSLETLLKQSDLRKE